MCVCLGVIQILGWILIKEKVWCVKCIGFDFVCQDRRNGLEVGFFVGVFVVGVFVLGVYCVVWMGDVVFGVEVDVVDYGFEWIFGFGSFSSSCIVVFVGSFGGLGEDLNSGV